MSKLLRDKLFLLLLENFYTSLGVDEEKWNLLYVFFGDLGSSLYLTVDEGGWYKLHCVSKTTLDPQLS